MKKNLGQRIKELFSSSAKKQALYTEEFYDDLTDSLIEGDLGAKTAYELVEKLEKICSEKKISDPEQITNHLHSMLKEFVFTKVLSPQKDKVSIYLLLGVNGVGKTTTCAKLAKYYTDQGVSPVVLAAADTFRAAAIEQLTIHAERLGVRIVSHQHGSDPGAVIFDAAAAVHAKGGGLVIADTAGRLHNRENLVNELKKIDRIASSKASPDCYKKIMVLDSTTGQNGLRQAEVFNSEIGLDGIILTKYDSTARGGIACSVGKELSLPVLFTGFGEGYSDLGLFDPDKYLMEFLQ